MAWSVHQALYCDIPPSKRINGWSWLAKRNEESSESLEQRDELEKIVFRLRDLYSDNNRLCKKLVAKDEKSLGQENLTIKLTEQLRRVSKEVVEESDHLCGVQLHLSVLKHEQEELVKENEQLRRKTDRMQRSIDDVVKENTTVFKDIMVHQKRVRDSRNNVKVHLSQLSKANSFLAAAIARTKPDQDKKKFFCKRGVSCGNHQSCW